MKTFMKIWKDPVGSKIIASIIMIAITAISGAISKNWTMDGVISILQIPVPLWMLLVTCILYVIVNFFVSQYSQTSFLEYVKEDDIYGFTWTWNWKKNDAGKYQICDIHPSCKKCGQPLVYDAKSQKYVCLNGHLVQTDKVNFGLAANEIQRRIREKYPKEAIKYFKLVNYAY